MLLQSNRYSSEGTAIRKTTLSSGLRVLTERITSAHSLALGVWIDTGSRDERPEENGISHFIEHCVFKGTKRRRTHHIAQYLESVGGYLNAFTSKDNTCYYARVLRPHLGRAVHLLADIVLHSTFPEKEVEKEKQVILEEMRGTEDDPEELLHEQFELQMFGRHPLGQPIIGQEPQVRMFTSEHLHRFVHQHYVGGNMVVAAAGAVDHERLVAECEKEFATLPRGAQTRRRKPGTPPSRHHVIHRPFQQAHIIIGCAAEGYRGPRRHQLAVLNTLLGEGMSSRLFQRIRERYGYAYNIYSFLSMFTDVSVFGVYAAVDADRVTRATEVLYHELDELTRTPVSVRELNRAKQQLTGTLMLGLESMTNRMTRIGRDELLYGQDVPVDELIQHIQSVTPDEIRNLATDLFRPGRLSSRTLLPGDGNVEQGTSATG
ncbi:MAG: insulinase family protein [Bacteroidetes bacterium]|nr:insulinase family protein [Bacteroidota bacterium]